MLLTKDKYISLNIIEGLKPDNAQTIAYDLTIDCVYKNNEAHEKVTEYALASGETVFIASEENIKLPNDIYAEVIARYSAIRKGLTIASPTYIPGHHTKIFTRVSNISSNTIVIKKGESVASLTLHKLDADVSEPYTGTYQSEFYFKKAGIYHSVPTPTVIKADEVIEEKIESIKNIEKKIYDHIMIIMTVFITAFSIVNLNANFLNSGKGVADMLVYNLTFLGGLGMLVTFVSMIMQDIPSKAKITIAALSLTMIMCAVALVK